MQTFSTRELVATKIRALYQRKKSRDVFDMWLALTELGSTGVDLLQVFAPYHPATLTAKASVANLRAKLADNDFRRDLDPFITQSPAGWDLDAASELIIEEVLAKIPGRGRT